MATIINSSKIQDKNARMVIDRFAIADEKMGLKRQKWKNLLTMYDVGSMDNLKKQTDERGKSQNNDQSISSVSASVLYNAVETLYPRLAGMFNPEGWFTVSPAKGTVNNNGYTTTLRSAKLVQDTLQQQIDESKMNSVLLYGIKQAVKIGTQIVKTLWRKTNGRIYVRELDASGQTERFVEKEGVTYEGAWLERLAYWNFYPDPKGRTIDECEYVIEDGTMTIEEMEEYAESGYFDSKIVGKLKNDMEKNEGFFSDPTTMNDLRYNSRDPYRTAVRVLTYQEDNRYIYEAIPFWSTGVTNMPSTFDASGAVALNPKNQENPFAHNTKQYVELNINFEEEDIFVKGVIEPLRDEQAIETSMLNMTLEALVKIIRPQMLYSDDLGFDVKDVVNYVPGAWTKTDADAFNTGIQNKVFPLAPEVNVLNALRGIMLVLKGVEQDKSGLTDTLRGDTGVGSNKTFRGIALLNQNASTRLGTPRMALEVGCTKILEMMLSLNQQYLNNPAVDIYGQYNFKLFENSEADRSAQLQVLQGMLPIIAQMGGNVGEVVERILDAGGVGSIDTILPKDGSMEDNFQTQQREGVLQMLQQQGGQPQ